MSDTWESLGTLFNGLQNSVSRPFKDQRQATPDMYRSSNELVRLSKQGIDELLMCRWDDAAETEGEIISAWRGLLGHRAPPIFAMYMSAEAGKELVEFLIARRIFPYLIGEDKSINFQARSWVEILPEKLGMGEMIPVWFFGAVDALSELSRMIDRYIVLNRKTLSREQRIETRERYLKMTEEWYRFLDEIQMIAVPGVLDDTNQRGFRNSFRSVLNRPRGAINHQLTTINAAIEASV